MIFPVPICIWKDVKHVLLYYSMSGCCCDRLSVIFAAEVPNGQNSNIIFENMQTTCSHCIEHNFPRSYMYMEGWEACATLLLHVWLLLWKGGKIPSLFLYSTLIYEHPATDHINRFISPQRREV